MNYLWLTLLRHLYSPWATWFDIFIILFNDVNRFYVWIKCLKVLRPTACMYVCVNIWTYIYVNIIKKERKWIFLKCSLQVTHRLHMGTVLETTGLMISSFQGRQKALFVCEEWNSPVFSEVLRKIISAGILWFYKTTHQTSFKRHIRYPCYLCFKTERAGHLHSL